MKVTMITCHLLTWHEHLHTASSGLMLFLVREMYDPTVQGEAWWKGKDVQSTIEAPQLHMLGASVRCKRFLSSKAIARLNVIN